MWKLVLKSSTDKFRSISQSYFLTETIKAGVSFLFKIWTNFHEKAYNLFKKSYKV